MRNTAFPSKLLLSILSLAFFHVQLSAQVTTATLGGTVTTPAGAALAGATIEISYPDAGIKRHIVSSSSGSYLVPNLRVGGPYTITVSYTGFAPRTENNVFLSLGQTS